MAKNWLYLDLVKVTANNEIVDGASRTRCVIYWEMHNNYNLKTHLQNYLILKTKFVIEFVRTEYVLMF